MSSSSLSSASSIDSNAKFAKLLKRSSSIEAAATSNAAANINRVKSKTGKGSRHGTKTKNTSTDNGKRDSIIGFISRHHMKLTVLTYAILHLLNQISIFEPFLNKFFKLQYKIPGSEYYDIGIDDSYFVFNWVIILIFLRSFFMSYMLGPIAIQIFHIVRPKAVQRFKEQGWSLFYYGVSWSYGYYLYYHSDYFFQCDNIYVGWPHDKLSFSFKCYYLVQMSCWLQQIFVLNIEEKRKDYIHMFSHHIITCALIIGSYYYYFTRIGHIILVLMDVVDVFLSLAKMLKYCGYTTVCDAAFVVFLISWILLRHIAYNYLFYHAWSKARILMDYNCRDVLARGIIPKRCYTDRSIDIFLILLGCLQIVAIIWMFLILKVAYRVITGDGAEDVRSDSEDSEEKGELKQIKKSTKEEERT